MPDTEDRVDGRMLIDLGEPGSDALLLRGLLLRLAAREIQEENDDESEPPATLRERIRERRESRRGEAEGEADPTAIDPDEPTG